MLTRRSLLTLALCTLAVSLSSAFGITRADEPRILFVTQSKTFVHNPVKRANGELASSEIAMRQLAKEKGYKIDFTQNVAEDFTVEKLKNYNIVMFYTTGFLPISDEARDYFINDWLKQKGHGFIGVHSASDTFHSAGNKEENEKGRWYWEMIGGSFVSHPWTSGDDVVLAIHEPTNILMKPFGEEFKIRDEIYMYHNWQPESVRVLMSLDMEKTKKKNPRHVPVSWIRSWGDGRIYYNNLGHNDTTWANPAYLTSINSAIEWINGKFDLETTPNPEVSEQQEEAAKKAAG
jgi:type 1 glutamine amidotransferase